MPLPRSSLGTELKMSWVLLTTELSHPGNSALVFPQFLPNNVTLASDLVLALELNYLIYKVGITGLSLPLGRVRSFCSSSQL